MSEYYEDIEFELYNYDSPQEDDEDDIDPEVWQDLNSEELLNLWMSIVEYHDHWYLPLNRSFNEFCEFVFENVSGTCPSHDEIQTHVSGTCPNQMVCPEIQAIKSHPWIKNLDWNYFFSLNYK